jgi:hypothetical protein
VGIEIKASSTVAAGDFGGLRHLAERIGDDFIAGIVLYTGTQTLPFGPRLRGPGQRPAADLNRRGRCPLSGRALFFVPNGPWYLRPVTVPRARR